MLSGSSPSKFKRIKLKVVDSKGEEQLPVLANEGARQQNERTTIELVLKEQQ